MTSSRLLLASLLAVSVGNVMTSESYDVRLGLILPSRAPQPWIVPQVTTAIQVALEAVSQRGWLPGKRLMMQIAQSTCSPTDDSQNVIDSFSDNPPHVFLGPACDNTLASFAAYSNQMGIPILTPGGLGRAFQDKSEYRQLTRILGSYDKSAQFLVVVFERFSWDRAILVLDEEWEVESGGGGSVDCGELMEDVQRSFMSTFNTMPSVVRFRSSDLDLDYRRIMTESVLSDRVIVMCASPNTVRELLIQARDLTFDNEQYVFINIDLFDNHRTPQPWFDAADTKERNVKARKAFESLMTVTLRKPASEEYRMFSRAVNRRATYTYQDFTLGENESRDSVSSFVSAFHDAVLLYALALNETLEAGGDVTDGVSITNRIRNRTFQGIAGTVSIDENGDRNPDYSVFAFNPREEAMEVAGTYYGSSKRYEQAPGTSLD